MKEISQIAFEEEESEKESRLLERECFQVIASLEEISVFEYKIQDDTMVNISYSISQGKQVRKIGNFSVSMKESEELFIEDVVVFDEFIAKMRSGQENIVESELRLREQEQEYSWYSFVGKTIFEDGKAVRIVGKITNIDERKNEELKLRKKTLRDSLTDLYNRTAIQNLIDEDIHKQKDKKRSMLLIHLNNFQMINDNLGRMFGDEVLRSVAKEMSGILPKEDKIGRIGGAEFVLWTDTVDQKELSHKIACLHKLFKESYTGDKNTYEIESSIGVSYYPEHGAEHGELFDKAEQALYYALYQGRNAVEIYDNALRKSYIKARQKLGYKLEDAEVFYEEATHEDENSFDYHLVQFAFQLMEESKDVESAIHLLLRKVGRHYDLSAITITEVTEELFSLNLMYEWCAKGIASAEGSTLTFEAKEWFYGLNAFGKDGIYERNHVQNNEGSPQKENVLGQMGVRSSLNYAIREDGVFVGCISFLDCKKEREWTTMELNSMKTVSKIISSYLLKMRAYEEASATVERLTGYDDVTGLLKYERFLIEAKRVLRLADEKEPFVVVYSDISNFKYINENYGYSVGNAILKDFADFLTVDDTVNVCSSRVVSDNIVSLVRLRNVMTEAQCLETVMLLNDKFVEMQRKKSGDRNIMINSGIYRLENNLVDVATAVANANLARKRSKLSGMPRCVMFNEEMDLEIRHQIEFTKNMKQGLENREFVVYYQPKIESERQKIVGAEALIRWIKPDGSMIFPNQFIPIFEKNGSIIHLDYFVYEEVCRYLRNRLDKNQEVVPISMNVSRIHLENYRTVKFIEELIKKYRIDPELLEFELTENIYVENLTTALHMVEELKALGVKVSIDDFGSGYSSLNVLKQLSFDVLKLDKDFLRDYELKQNDEIVISSIVEMAKRLKVIVLCEGVETEQQVSFLRDIGCDLMQGYYFSKPVDVKTFNSKLEQQQKVMTKGA